MNLAQMARILGGDQDWSDFNWIAGRRRDTGEPATYQPIASREAIHPDHRDKIDEHLHNLQPGGQDMYNTLLTEPSAPGGGQVCDQADEVWCPHCKVSVNVAAYPCRDWEMACPHNARVVRLAAILWPNPDYLLQ
jgi:hypothetical protein